MYQKVSSAGKGKAPYRYALQSASVCAAVGQLAVAKEEFRKLLEMDIIQPSSSPWSSTLHMVAKPSGGWRAGGAYRALNAVSEDDRYSMPHLQDFTIQLEDKNIFSKVDLVRAYNQVPMNTADVAKTSIVTPFGLFEYKRMPFGLKNAALGPWSF